MVDGAEQAGAEEQVLYARVLEAGSRIGFVMLILSFAVYTTGLVEPAVPIGDLPLYWSLDATTFLETVNAECLHREHPPTGWTWVTELNHADFLNFAGIAVLSAVTILCYAWILPVFIRKKDRIYAAIASAEILVLVLAASGLLRTGGH